MKFIIFILLAIYSVSCSADIDGCKEMSKKNSDIMLPRFKEAFIAAHRFSIDRVNITRGRDCVDSIYFVFEAKPKYADFGSNWIVTMDKKSRKIQIQDGI
jgi:hypothetical protein